MRHELSVEYFLLDISLELKIISSDALTKLKLMIVSPDILFSKMYYLRPNIFTDKQFKILTPQIVF